MSDIKFEQLQKAIAKYYKSEIKYSDNKSKTLIITFAVGGGYDLYKYKFEHTVLFIGQKQNCYYTINPLSSVRAILQFAKGTFENIIFLGRSKGGFAALLWAGLAASRGHSLLLRDIKIYSIVFNPITKIYPYNSNVKINRSYRSMIAKTKTDLLLAKALKRFGSTEFLNKIKSEKFYAVLVFPIDFPMDRMEGERIHGSRIKHYTINMPFHGASLPFLIDTQNPEVVSQTVKKIYAKDRDEDLAAHLPKDPNDLIKIISSCKAPSLNRFLNQVLGSGGEVENSTQVLKGEVKYVTEFYLTMLACICLPIVLFAIHPSFSLQILKNIHNFLYIFF